MKAGENLSEHAYDAHGTARDPGHLEVHPGGGDDIVRHIEEQLHSPDYEGELKTIASVWDKPKRSYHSDLRTTCPPNLFLSAASSLPPKGLP